MSSSKKNRDKQWKDFCKSYDDFHKWIDKYWNDEKYWEKQPSPVKKPKRRRNHNG